MKKSRQLIISSLVALTSITLASSITSTIAWFQYATRATVAYTGTTAHCSKLLNISVDGGAHWGTDISKENLPSGIKFSPITTGEQLKNEALATYEKVTEYEDDGITPKTTVTKTRFYDSPDYRQGLYSNWLYAKDDSYLQFTVLVKLTDVDENYGKTGEHGEDEQTYLANDVYLTDLTIQNAGTNDLAHAVRVHFDALSPNGTHKYFLFAKDPTLVVDEVNDEDDVYGTPVGGYLDLNGDGQLDTAGYEFDDLCLYGGSDGAESRSPVYGTDPVTGDPIITGYTLDNPLIQSAYATDDGSVVATDNKGTLTNGVSFGSTSATEGEYLQIVVTIWLEGWSELQKGIDGGYQEEDTSVWDSASYASKNFNVGMTFGVQLHTDADHN